MFLTNKKIKMETEEYLIPRLHKMKVGTNDFFWGRFVGAGVLGWVGAQSQRPTPVFAPEYYGFK